MRGIARTYSNEVMRMPIVHNEVRVVFDLEENIKVATTYWVAAMIGLNKIKNVVSWKRAYATDPTGVVIHVSELNKSAFPMILVCVHLLLEDRVKDIVRCCCCVSFPFVVSILCDDEQQPNSTQQK